MFKVGRLAFVYGVAATLGAAGCFLAEPDDTDQAGSEVNEGADMSEVLKSTIILEGGCVATRVGPKHLVLAARCVSGKAAISAGKKVKFKKASEGAVATAVDAGAADAADAGRRDAGSAPRNDFTIDKVEINASFTAKCAEANACGLGTVKASEAKDIAVLLVKDEDDLEGLTELPIDLDTVGEADPVLTVSSGCERLDGTAGKLKTVKTVAVPAKSVNHEGSPFLDSANLVGGLSRGYVVTAGPGWPQSPDETRLCANDLGAPLFRANHAAVVGITSNFTTFENAKQTPVTVHHTRVDTASKVGTWLTTLGVKTTKTCSESESKCEERSFDGGAPRPPTTSIAPGDGTTSPRDGGTTLSDAGLADAGKDTDEDEDETDEPPPPPGQSADIPEAEEQTQLEPNGDGGTRKRKKKAAGCSASPGTSSDGSSLLLAFGVGAVLVAARRRTRGA